MTPNTIQVAADVGGTFTDVVLTDEKGRLWTRKVPSTPPNFERAVLEAVERLLQDAEVPASGVAKIAHGTTVATNAVLERRGARTALITTRGFRDVLELRRLRAPQIYDLFFDKPPTIVERRLRYEITERLSASGQVLHPLAEDELGELPRRLEEAGIESVAVCLLHAYAHPQHEQRIGEHLAKHMPDLPVSLSSQVVRERKEYERTATTAVNAYVRPVMRRYLDEMHSGLRELGISAPLLMMQSAGGLTTAQDAALRPVFVLESGPAAGVLAAAHVAKQLGVDNVISFDMGGTTAKAAMIEGGRIPHSPEYEVGASMSSGNRLVGGGGEMILAPTVDIAEVGAGGGSIAQIDAGGGLRVGPHSAGAVPGPACYGRGGENATVTDANAVLGYILPGPLAAGDVSVDTERAARAVHDRIARPLGLKLIEAALGIHRIANARIMRALKEVSTQRGRDPRQFAFIAFGGSGPIHAAGLARQLHTLRVIVPPMPGLFSAAGLLVGGVEHHDVRSCLLSGDALSAGALDALRRPMQDSMLDQFRAESFAETQVQLTYSADVRFGGQASVVNVRIPCDSFDARTVAAISEDFEHEHERLYGHGSDPENPVEVLALRLVGRASTGAESRLNPPVSGFKSRDTSRRAVFGDPWGTIDTPVLKRSDLKTPTNGPILIDEYDSTIVVPPDMRAALDEGGNVVMEVVS